MTLYSANLKVLVYGTGTVTENIDAEIQAKKSKREESLRTPQEKLT